jgi:hypothetical protein
MIKTPILNGLIQGNLECEIKNEAPQAGDNPPAGSLYLWIQQVDDDFIIMHRDSDGNDAEMNAAVAKEASLDGQPELYENYLYWWRLDDVNTQVWFQGAFDSPKKLRFRAKSADSGESGNVALKIVANGIEQAEQVFAIPAGGTLSGWLEADITGVTGACSLAFKRDTASENDTLNASLLLLDPCEVL